jgi:hypothetical protein
MSNLPKGKTNNSKFNLEQSNFNCVSCHLIGFNPYSKKDFVDKLNKKTFNVIDLDSVNQEILIDPHLDKMYKQYQKLKDDKNDKFKEVDKKMSQFWEKNFIEKVESCVNEKRVNILIGQNNHYKSLTKRVNIECTNKFIVKSDTNEEVKAWIRFNIDTYKEDIIQGNFPLEYINYEYLHKKRLAIESTYKKIGYIEKSVDQLKTIIKLIEDSSKTKGNKIWVSMKEPYNIGSLIHPKSNDKISGFADPNIALLGSFNFTNDEVKRNFNGSEITIQELKPQSMKKLKTRRFLYLVEPKTFIPHENGNNQKFFSQLPVKILAKERIDNVHNYFIADSEPLSN